MSLTSEAVKVRAEELGFDAVGITSAAATPGGEALRRWLDNGYHGEMGYMDETAELRLDPRELLTGCRSVVVVAMSYRTDRPPSSEHQDPNRVWVSRYAWGRDYHKILKKRLVRLGRWLGAEGHDWRACVDTVPIMERAWAAAAGLGWIGKSTQLINRQLGSEVFLGVLLTSASLEPDQRGTEHCGKCTACLDACPTSAFPEPGILDARRCIAYLTVEHRGPIDPQRAEGLGNMVAGCDICQEVCPWTIRAPASRHPEFEPAAHRYNPLAKDLMALDEQGYREWRQGSALNRIPFDQMRRNLELVEDKDSA